MGLRGGVLLGSIVAAGLLLPTPAEAAPIIVGEFRWDLVETGCAPATDGCPVYDSIFTLTNLWDGPGQVTLFDSRLSLPGEADQFYFDLASTGEFDRLFPAQPGIPGSAAVQLALVFDERRYSLHAALAQPETFAVLQLTPVSVPEPGTLALLGVGVVCLAWRRRVR